MKKRRRFKQTETLQERLNKFAADILEQANKLPLGQEREDLIKRARRADTAANIDQWASSLGLQPPT
ncbi:hypothetical protein JQ633_01240 [Bradyrhizobium tropiciagri]|uniref:hypothetical protein n=1 Tax=Bradyrhizobium tropiciagri TaxID=312253 RepID=UPI001BA6C908|nr:hypothetical protein [Bradyrhizobium tropiciagri]MBR0868965.1 hypothetical protein [Bradyrhizobium tropiciagri]